MKDQTKQEIQDKVEEVIDKVKVFAEKKSTKDVAKVAAGAALIGGLFMLFGKKKE